MNLIQSHPNALVSLGAGLGLGSLVVQIGRHYGLNLSTQEGLYVASGLSMVALFVGRNGALGTWAFVRNVVLHGTGGGRKRKAKK